jgi:hypothetical protein
MASLTDAFQRRFPHELECGTGRRASQGARSSLQVAQHPMEETWVNGRALDRSQKTHAYRPCFGA